MMHSETLESLKSTFSACICPLRVAADLSKILRHCCEKSDVSFKVSSVHVRIVPGGSMPVPWQANPRGTSTIWEEKGQVLGN